MNTLIDATPLSLLTPHVFHSAYAHCSHIPAPVPNMAVNAIAPIDGIRRYVDAFNLSPMTGNTHIVVRTMDGHLHRVDPMDVAMLPAVRTDLPFPTRPVIALRVHSAFTVRSSEETACNYREFEIQPGDYSVRWTSAQGIPTRDGQAPYYGVAETDAIETRSYFVSSAFGRTLGVDDEKPMRATTRTIDDYAYNVTPGKGARDGSWEYVEIAPATGEVFPG